MLKSNKSGITLAASLMPIAWFAATANTLQGPTALEFRADIAPILRAHCSPCHTGTQASGGLSMESYESLMKGGVVVKGSAKESPLMQRIMGTGGMPRMPLGFKPLDNRDSELIRIWIENGAKLTTKALRQHWAFIPPKRPALPKGAANPIDAFIVSRIEKEGLHTSPIADKSTLIRRLSLDLIGLPPKVSEIEAFLADRSPRAYEKVVDRLLASPHYGERMALPWLDAARYADSNGFQQDGDTYQYVWRDWVVKALNANMPFDQFTIEQLAGDLLPKPTLDQFVATGFNRNHMLNGEGGAIPEEQRNVNLFDRVDTTSATWLSLTMGCTRCHNHKYDPLTQRDYFSMMAYFNRVPESGVPAGSGQYRIADPWIYAGDSVQMATLRKAEAEVRRSKAAELALLESPTLVADFEKWRISIAEDLLKENVVTSPWFEVGTFIGTSFDQAFTNEFGPEKGKFDLRNDRKDFQDGKVIPLTGDNTAFYFQRTIRSEIPVRYLLSLGSDDAIKVWLNGREVFSNKATRAAVPDSDRVIVNLQTGDNTILMKIVNGGGIGGFYFRGFVGGVDDATATLIKSTKPEDAAKLRAAFAATSVNPELAKHRKSTEQTEVNLAKIRETFPRVMVMSDAMARKTHILRRGNYEEPTDEVQPSTPAALSVKNAVPKNRLGLAKWIVSPENPLTARVQVNRAWQLFFGRGLVRTEENFGIKGEPPTHPELLDWLAVDLRENGWNMKRLHKQIVMSSTYRQSSKITPEMFKRDPENLLFARAPRFRLPSMILRDVALAASGLLDPKLGGKPVYPYQPMGIWDGLSITLERDFTYPQSEGKDNYRRSLYTFWRRTAAPGNMFDSSSRQVCTVKPTLTSTPLHSLTMMNDITWVEAGIALASSVLSKQTDDQRLSGAFFKVCSRKPNAQELLVLRRSLERARKAYQADPKLVSDYFSQGFFKSKAKTPELAALAAVCTAILNLNEAVTRE